MIKIEDLLKDYKNIKNPQAEKKEILNALNTRFSLDIKENQLFLRKNAVVFKVGAIQKNFIYIRKEDILNIIKTIVPDRFISNIQF